MEGRENEDGRFAHTWLRLTNDVHAQDSLRDAVVLNYKIDDNDDDRCRWW